jgi:septum formation protein
MAPRLLLASRSPRRRELLAQLGLVFEVIDVDVPEQRGPGESPAQYVARVARDKALAGQRAAAAGTGVVVLGADTEVVLDGEVFGKPADEAAAAAMLRRLAGRSHEVLSAVCCVAGDRVESALSVSRVTFGALGEDAIGAYIATGEPFGKAGAYAIQGRAAAFVQRLEGSYSGVMGLPLHETAQLLGHLGAWEVAWSP